MSAQKGLIGGVATSRRDLESADAQSQADEAGLAALDAQIAQARAQTDFAATNLSYTKITAPIEGEVVAILTQEGQTVVATQIVPVILKLANLDAMTVKTQVSEADVIKVHVGQPVSFTILGDQDKRYGASCARSNRRRKIIPIPRRPRRRRPVNSPRLPRRMSRCSTTPCSMCRTPRIFCASA